MHLQLREKPFQHVPAVDQKVARQNAGTMLVTKYTLKAAETYWEQVIMPGLRKFCQIIRQLCQSRELCQAFLAVPDKEAWYAAQTALVRS